MPMIDVYGRGGDVSRPAPASQDLAGECVLFILRWGASPDLALFR